MTQYAKHVTLKHKNCVCDICDKSFSREATLKLHKLKVHIAPKPLKYQDPLAEIPTCEICGKTFSSKFGLWNHQKVHSTDKPFKCDICQKTFKRKANYLEHQSIHTGVKGYECDICHQKFRLYKGFQSHYSIHTGEKPHCCPVCSQAFRLKADMKNHLKRHSTDKNLTVEGQRAPDTNFEELLAATESLKWTA